MSGLKKVFKTVPMSEREYFDQLYSSISRDGKIMCLGMLLERSADLFGQNTALICNKVSISYRNLYYRVSLLSKKLEEKEIKKGDRVLVFVDNSIEFYVAYFAVVQIGAVVAPLNIYLHEQELRHIVQDAQPSCIITSSTHLALFNSIQAEKDALILTEQDMDMVSAVPEQFEPFKITYLEPDQMAALLYTSGTTGLPKGVMLSSKNILTNVVQLMARARLNDAERVLGVLPLFHSFSQNKCVWSSFFAGWTVIIVPKVDRRAIVAALLEEPTIVLGVPALYGLFCLMKTAPFINVKYFVSGGDAMPDRIRMAFELIYRRKIISGYGMTESCPVLSGDFEDILEPTNCVGLPLIDLQCKIIDADGNEQPINKNGQIIVKGDNVMLGYYNASEATANTIIDGWLYTGDLGYIDEYGKIVITGRQKDIIKHKGFIIYPQEIENVITSYSNVIRVGVVGKKDQESGETVIAFVQIAKAEENIETKLKDFCKKHLASYKIPKEFVVTTQELPVTATGKVDKKVLRKQLEN